MAGELGLGVQVFKGMILKEEGRRRLTTGLFCLRAFCSRLSCQVVQKPSSLEPPVLGGGRW